MYFSIFTCNTLLYIAKIPFNPSSVTRFSSVRMVTGGGGGGGGLNRIIYKTLINDRTNCGSNLKRMYQINTPFSVMYILFALDYRVNISSYSE